jgi:hypothetical protein
MLKTCEHGVSLLDGCDKCVEQRRPQRRWSIEEDRILWDSCRKGLGSKAISSRLRSELGIDRSPLQINGHLYHLRKTLNSKEYRLKKREPSRQTTFIIPESTYRTLSKFSADSGFSQAKIINRSLLEFFSRHDPHSL